jgi:hypothetical protein
VLCLMMKGKGDKEEDMDEEGDDTEGRGDGTQKNVGGDMRIR